MDAAGGLCALLGDAPRAERLYGLLAPFADLNVVIGWARSARGPRLAISAYSPASMGRRAAARDRFARRSAPGPRCGAIALATCSLN